MDSSRDDKPGSAADAVADRVNRRQVLQSIGAGAVAGSGLVAGAGTTSGHPVEDVVFCGCGQVCACGQGDVDVDVVVARTDGDEYDCHEVRVTEDDEEGFQFCHEDKGKVVAIVVDGDGSKRVICNPNESCAGDALDDCGYDCDNTGESGGPCGDAFLRQCDGDTDDGDDDDDDGDDHDPLADGLVAYYPADDPEDTSTLTDVTGGNGAALRNGASYNGSGRIGSDSVSFDGDDDYAEAPGIGPRIDEANAFTIAFWVKYRSLVTYRVLYGYEPANFYVEPYHSGSAGVTIAFEDEDGTEHELNSGTILESEGVWYHIAYTWDGEVIVAYLDGSQVGTLDTGGVSIATGDPHYIGRWGESGFHLDGLMDDIRVYDRALSSDEVQRLATLDEPTDLQGDDTNDADEEEEDEHEEEEEDEDEKDEDEDEDREHEGEDEDEDGDEEEGRGKGRERGDGNSDDGSEGNEGNGRGKGRGNGKGRD